MLTENVLEGMVENTVSIDRLTPKTYDTGVVVQFEVQELDAAYDLSSFLEKSTPLSLDTEVSDYPNKDGYYMVFVELERTHDVVDKIIKTLQYADRLCNNKEWFFYNSKGQNKVPVNKDTLKQFVVPKELETLRLFFDKADASFTLSKENTLTVKVGNATFTVEYIDIKSDAEIERMIEKDGIDISKINRIDGFCNRLGSMYEGIATKTMYIVSKKDSNKNLVFKF